MENTSAPHAPYAPATTVASTARPPRTQGSPVESSDHNFINVLQYGRSGWLHALCPLDQRILAPRRGTYRAAGARCLPALLHASGMAAVANALHLAPAGSTIIVPRHAYHASLLVAYDRARREDGRIVEVDIPATPKRSSPPSRKRPPAWCGSSLLPTPCWRSRTFQLSSPPRTKQEHS